MNSKNSIFKFIIFIGIVLLMQSHFAFAISDNQIKNLNTSKISAIKNINNVPKSQQLSQNTDKDLRQLNYSESINERKKYGEPSFFSLLSSLSIVIVLIFLTGWIYAKLSRINTDNLFAGKLSQISNNTFKIISTVQLGSNKSLHLIEINNKQLIIGCTQDKINLITEMNKGSDNKLIETFLAENNSSMIDNTLKNANDINNFSRNEEENAATIQNENIYKKYLN